MRKDIKRIIQRCEECQKHSNIQIALATKLSYIFTSIPFARWGIDIVDPFLVANRGRKFLFVTIDYFTKWVEVEAVKNISQENAINFKFKDIICRFGVPVQISINNGS